MLISKLSQKHKMNDRKSNTTKKYQTVHTLKGYSVKSKKPILLPERASI